MKGFIDTHTHLYLDQFDDDRSEAVNRALEKGVDKMLLPNVDQETIEPMLKLCEDFPGHCLPMMGLHPTSVKPGYEKHLQEMYSRLKNEYYVAVGETGIDLYWDKTHKDLQIMAFCKQIEWALEFKLPVVIHSRNSVDEIMEILEPYRNTGLRGVMHCFPGNREQAKWFIDFGFVLGIGGVVTYKKSLMADMVKETGLEHLILETDAPYLPPVPCRGKRNEPAFLPFIAQKIADIKELETHEVEKITSLTSKALFGL